MAWVDVMFWFNPFLRAQSRKCRLAAEVACDAAVTAAAPSMRKAYASMIVVALQHAAGDALACAPAAISPRNLGDYGMRITEIMSPSGRRSKRAGWAAFVLAAVLAIPAGAVQLAYAQAASGSAPFMVLPLHGRISSAYGDTHSFFGKPRIHDGVDIVAPEGAPVVAPAAGTVVHASLHDGNYGAVVAIAHGNGLMTRYAHLESIDVRQGEEVKAGQLIAHVGSTGISTGPHLHLQVLRNGRSINPAEVFDLSKL
jgi:murein DD-endopeptidase MepM/ murein hydrolase activator NlpD